MAEEKKPVFSAAFMKKKQGPVADAIHKTIFVTKSAKATVAGCEITKHGKGIRIAKARKPASSGSE